MVFGYKIKININNVDLTALFTVLDCGYNAYYNIDISI
jgi:hypothetical protein